MANGPGKGTTYAGDLLQLIFNGTALTVGGSALAINATSSPLGVLYIALHTADPGLTGSQNTSETTYTSYGRVSVTRTSAGWTVTANTVVPAAAIQFAAGTGGSGTVTNWTIGVATSGAGAILYDGTVSPNIYVGNGITPILTVASYVSET